MQHLDFAGPVGDIEPYGVGDDHDHGQRKKHRQQCDEGITQRQQAGQALQPLEIHLDGGDTLPLAEPRAEGADPAFQRCGFIRSLSDLQHPGQRILLE